MDIVLDIVLFGVGLALVLWGAERFTDGAVQTAARSWRSAPSSWGR